MLESEKQQKKEKDEIIASMIRTISELEVTTETAKTKAAKLEATAEAAKTKAEVLKNED